MAAHEFFEGFVPITSLYAIMFSRVGGLNIQQVGALFAIWSLCYLASEIPSGILADYWSRKWTLFASGLVRAACFAIWLLWPGFTGYAVGFALWGVAIACGSGATTAYIHDELRAEGKSKKFAKYYGYLMSVNMVGGLVALGIAAALTLQHANVLIALSLAGSLMMSFVLLFLPEHPYNKQATYLKTMTAAYRQVVESKQLQYLCWVLFAIFMTIGVLEELLPRVYANFGLNDTAVSLIIAASLLLAAVLVARLEWISKFSLSKQALAMCAGSALLLAGLAVGGWAGSLLAIGFALTFNFFRPAFMHHVADAATGDERSTIGSIPGMAAGLLGAGAYWVIGRIAASTSENAAIALYALVLLLVFAVLSIVGRRYRLPSHTRQTPPTPNPQATTQTVPEN